MYLFLCRLKILNVVIFRGDFVKSYNSFLTMQALFLTICAKYGPPNSASYTYPDFAIAIGQFFAILPMLPVPIAIIWGLVHSEGTFLQVIVNKASLSQYIFFICIQSVLVCSFVYLVSVQTVVLYPSSPKLTKIRHCFIYYGSLFGNQCQFLQVVTDFRH